jgi:RsiW-degrading membrane proteinase PrsW (M82 family)
MLTLTAIVGALLAVYGLSMLVEPLRVSDLTGVFKPIVGVALMVIGSLVAVETYRLLTTSGPDTPYAFGDPKQALKLFVGVWLFGSLIAATTQPASPSGIGFTLAVATVVGLSIAGAGAWWVFRWLASKANDEWPQETAAALHRRPAAWSVFFAFVWGILSTVVAIRLELFVVERVLPYVQSRISPSATPETVIPTLLRDPAIVIGAVAGVMIVAPLIEEACKAIGLWMFRGVIHAHGDGLILGLAIGLGFGFIESAGYLLGGLGSLAIFWLVWLRVATMLMHSVTTGLIGAGYARARLAHNPRETWSGLGRAVVAHGVWNTGVVLIVVSGALESNCLPLVVLAAMIAIAARLLPRIVSAAVDRSIQDDHALAGITLPHNYRPIDDGVWWRAAGGRPQYPLPDASPGAAGATPSLRSPFEHLG